MNKKVLLRISLLVLLAALLGVMVFVIRSTFASRAIPAMGEQTFFEQFVISGGPIVWFILLPMSLVTVYLAVEHCLTIRCKKLLPDGIGNEIIKIIKTSGAQQLKIKLADRNDFVSVEVTKAVTKGSNDWFKMRNILAESFQDQALELLRKIEWVNLIGNVSPMVGLFGTVFGMIKLFNAIVVSGGQPQPVHLASGISIALVTTFWGLFIAIPALAIHSIFRNRIETLISQAVIEAENIIPQIRLAAKDKKQPEAAAGQPIQQLSPKSKQNTKQSLQPL